MKGKVLGLILLVATVIRFWGLSDVPVSLFGDELDVGYHAYSILETGKDYSGNPWPLHFQSLAEWRTPLYLYSAVPTVAIWGVTPLGVRVPAALFGVIGVYALYLLVRQLTNNKPLANMASLVIALSPWHIQYSRAGFEVTMLFAFLILGLYFFFKSLKEGRWLWISVSFLTFTPWIYSTAKLFTPLLLIFLLITWRKELFKLTRTHLVKAGIALLVIGLPISYSTLFGGGSQRFGYVSVFTDPTTESEVGTDRQIDARVRGELGEGLQPNLIDRTLHNKFTFWGENVLYNYYQAYSSDFLFNKGDLNLRHSIEDIGQFYRIEAFALILGLIMFYTSKINKKVKALITFWLLIGVVPSAITRDGGRHATRLIIVLAPLVFLISYGLSEGLKFFKSASRKVILFIYVSIWVGLFIFYQHNFWVHNPRFSERWWHSGWAESIKEVKNIEKDFDKVIISMSGEPAWIFFAGHYMYSPELWHSEFPIGNDTFVEGFGEISHTSKFYFGSPDRGLYEWGQILDDKTLYLANASEVGPNLILEPERTPGNLSLIASIAFPSGEPAFYLFSGVKSSE